MTYEITGQKGVLIQLEKFPKESTTTESGIVIPQYKAYETEGGRPAAKIDEEIYTTIGTILQISTAARQLLEKENTSLEPGDKVMIHPSSKNPHNWFFPDRNQRVQDFQGLLLISPQQVQAKINEA